MHCHPEHFEKNFDPYCQLTAAAVKRIRALSPDPNWLDRQINEWGLETIYSVQSILMESKNLKHAISQVDGMRTRLDLDKATLESTKAKLEAKGSRK